MTEGTGLTKGDPEARKRSVLDEILASRDAAYWLALRVTGSREAAEDAVQEACAGAVRRVTEGEFPREARTWFLGAVANRARMSLRTEKRRRRREAQVSQSKAQAERDPEMGALLRGALGGLDEKYRLPIHLCCEQGLSRREAAGVLGIPERTVSQHVTDGLERLRRALGQQGYAAAAGAVAATLGGGPVISAPESLAAAVEAITRTAALSVAKAAGASLAWKTITAVSLAVIAAGGAVVGVRALGRGATERAAGSGPKAGPPAPAVAAGPVKFTSGPDAKRAGGKVTIEFAVNRPTDVAVWVEDSKGKIVRHIAAAMLGEKAPAPFKKGLAQSLEWDGTDDAGKKPAGGPFKVKVGLGLGHKFDKVIGWDPKAIRKIYSVAVGPKGEVFILWATPYGVSAAPRVAVLSREGKYLRTIIPYPANLPPERVAALKPIKLADGKVVPRVHHALASTFYPFLSGTQRQTMTVTSKGRLVMATGHFNYSTRGSMGPRRLLSLNLDGSCPKSFAGPVLDKRQWGGRPVEGYPHVAAAPDGDTVYVSGLYNSNSWSKEHVSAHVVLRAKLSAGPESEAKVFFGEKAKAGSDQKHLDDPRGVATDPEGNVYVADHGNNRIVKLADSGKFLGQIKVDNPDQIALNRKTGALYVVSIDHGKFKKSSMHPRAWVKKKVLKIKSWKEPKVVARIDIFNKLGNVLTLAVDDEATPPVLWIACAAGGTYHGTGRGLYRCLDKGDSLTEPKCVLGPEANSEGLVTCLYLAVNPVGEQVHVRGDRGANMWYVFDGRTGKRLKAPKLKWPGQERAFDRQGRMYLREHGAVKGVDQNKVVRFTAEGKPAPFSGTGKQAIEGMAGFMKALPRGFCVASSGDVYVLHYAGNPWKKGGMRTTVTVAGAGGKVKRTEVIGSMRTASSIRVDRAGNIYIAENVKSPGEPSPAELGAKPKPRGNVWGPRYDHAAWYPWMYGSIVKFGPKGGKIERGAGGKHLTGWPGWHKDKGAVKVTGAKWMRLAISPLPAVNQPCVCLAARFDIDGFDRIYVPDAGRCRVTVFDTQGNELTHFGDYGNVDSAGPRSAVPGPEIPLAWPGCVATSPEAIYISDWLNVRVVRVKPTYAKTGECPVR